jgi:hypothetical protein
LDWLFTRISIGEACRRWCFVGSAILWEPCSSRSVLYKLFQFILGKVKLNILLLNAIIKWGLLASGAYGAYALGGNSVANVTGVFARAGRLTVRWATIIGSLSIALGAITYSKRVMMTVGSGLVALDGFSAFVAVLSEAITIHIYVAIGVPVSTSQAIVGAVPASGSRRGAVGQLPHVDLYCDGLDRQAVDCRTSPRLCSSFWGAFCNPCVLATGD